MTLTHAEELELERLVQEQANDIEWLDQVEKVYPLATRTLWTAPKAEWDQRRAVITAMTAPRVTIVSGGWRSGKSVGLKELHVAKMLGGDHPAVRAWIANNGLPTNYIPDGPAQVYIVAQSSNDSIRYHRDDFDALVGPWGEWFNRNGHGEALLKVRVPHSKAVGKLWFKSIDQGRKAHQGISLRGAMIDEEPLGEIGFGVFEELLARVADQENGNVSVALVPMEGLTWMYDKCVRDGEYETRLVTLDALDNPFLREGFAGLYTGMSEEDLAVRRFGRFRSKSGAVFSMWMPGDGSRSGAGHMVDDFEIPREWPRFRAADFGIVNPTCVLWGALGDDGTLYIYREYYVPSGASNAWHADQVAALEGVDERGYGGEGVLMGWGDPAALEGRNAFNARGVSLAPADNSIQAGIDRIKDRLRIRSDNRPRLKVFRSCTNTLREMPGLLWNPKLKNELPIKLNDHTFDTLKYMVAGIEMYLGL